MLTCCNDGNHVNWTGWNICGSLQFEKLYYCGSMPESTRCIVVKISSRRFWLRALITHYLKYRIRDPRTVIELTTSSFSSRSRLSNSGHAEATATGYGGMDVLNYRDIKHWLPNKSWLYGSEASVLNTDVMLSMMMTPPLKRRNQQHLYTGSAWKTRSSSKIGNFPELNVDKLFGMNILRHLGKKHEDGIRTRMAFDSADRFILFNTFAQQSLPQKCVTIVAARMDVLWCFVLPSHVQQGTTKSEFHIPENVLYATQPVERTHT
ncbi:hypothetical protein CLF_106800 [Clonorchis sinensis]|uniref:Uncharacterized protein n=1 Tax=Clonorchis sinensis TaxID=79923 RepID=G7YFQ7_CLOSI|nr:hypothetical protein CLF_106800 [Clonorchis sinensis]